MWAAPAPPHREGHGEGLAGAGGRPAGLGKGALPLQGSPKRGIKWGLEEAAGLLQVEGQGFLPRGHGVGEGRG